MTDNSILVCGRWPLPLRPGIGGHYRWLGTKSDRNAECFLRLVENLTRRMSVVEHFGGVGIFSTIIQNVLLPREHRIFDLDVDCSVQLREAFGHCQDVTTARGDARQTMVHLTADLVVLDFPNATVRHHHEWPWRQMFERGPKYVVWSDVAMRRLHLHRELYSELLGHQVVTHQDYVLGYSKMLWELYGYSVIREAHHEYSYMLAKQVPYSPHVLMERV